MHDDFDQIVHRFAESAPEALSAAERARMRALLSEYVAFRPAPQRLRTWLSRVLATAFAVRGKAALAAATAACCVLASTGIAFAAEGTLPGSLLYGVKVDVVEPIQTALVFTPHAQTVWQQTLALRRLDEAATLASKGRLRPATEQRLAARFSASARAAAQNNAAQDAADPGATAVRTTAFSAQLAGYQEVFAHISTTDQASTTLLVAAIQAQDRDHVLALGPSVEHGGPETRGPMAGAMRTFGALHATTSARGALLAPAESTTSARIAAHMHSAANRALLDASDLVFRATGSVSSTTDAQARTLLQAAHAALQQGEALLSQHNSDSAVHALSSALSISTRIQVLMRASQALKIDAFSSSTTSEPDGAGTSTTTTTLPDVRTSAAASSTSEVSAHQNETSQSIKTLESTPIQLGGRVSRGQDTRSVR